MGSNTTTVPIEQRRTFPLTDAVQNLATAMAKEALEEHSHRDLIVPDNRDQQAAHLEVWQLINTLNRNTSGKGGLKARDLILTCFRNYTDAMARSQEEGDGTS